jgi:hypothetical protein
MFLERKINSKYYVTYLVLFAFTSQSLWEQAANANLTLKNSPRNQDRAYFLLYITSINQFIGIIDNFLSFHLANVSF